MSAPLNLRRARANAIIRRRQREAEYTRILVESIGNAAREAVMSHGFTPKAPEARH